MWGGRGKVTPSSIVGTGLKRKAVFSKTVKTVVNLKEYNEQVVFHIHNFRGIEIFCFKILKKNCMDANKDIL